MCEHGANEDAIVIVRTCFAGALPTVPWHATRSRHSPDVIDDVWTQVSRVLDLPPDRMVAVDQDGGIHEYVGEDWVAGRAHCRVPVLGNCLATGDALGDSTWRAELRKRGVKVRKSGESSDPGCGGSNPPPSSNTDG